MSRKASDLVRVRLIGDDYRAMSVRMRREAFVQQASERPLSAKIIERYAFIARRAARAEELDPDWAKADDE